MFSTAPTLLRFRFWRQSQSTLKSPRAQKKDWDSHRLFPAARLGLYDGVRIGNGHRVTKRQKHHIKRRFKPNIGKRRVYSVILGRAILTRLSTRAIRSIKRHGSLDKYIRTQSDDKLGEYGRKLRDEMADHATLQMQFERLGLVPSLESIRTEYMKNRRGPLNKLHKKQAWRNPEEREQEAAAASPLQVALRELREKEGHSFYGPVKQEQ